MIMEQKKEHINVVVALLSFILIVTAVALIGYLCFGDEKEPIQGQIEAREYQVSSKLSARVKRLCVEEGDYVHVGDTLAILQDPELDAQQQAAEATEQATQAISEMTENGTRQEQIQTAANLVLQAKAALNIALKTYQRVQKLSDEGVASTQKRDEAKAAYDAALAQVKVATSQWEMAKNGARKEEKKAAAEQAKAAGGGVDVVRSLLHETVQRATVEGEVEKIYAHDGELVGSGSPIMTISVLKDQWGSFFIREDMLHGIEPGKEIKVYSEAFNQTYPMRVYYMKVQGEYTTWKATKAGEGHALNTFEVRARPIGKCPDMRPGMTITLR